MTGVRSGAAVEEVSARVPTEAVVSASDEDCVVSGLPDQKVVSAAALDSIGAAVAVDEIRRWASDQGVGARRAEHVLNPVQAVLARSTRRAGAQVHRDPGNGRGPLDRVASQPTVIEIVQS